MAWLGDMVVDATLAFWMEVLRLAYRKLGWVGGALVLLAPFAVVAIMIWIVLR